MARDPIVSTRIDRANFARLESVCRARGLSRSEVMRGAILAAARSRSVAVAAPGAAELATLRALPTGEARARFRRLRRERRLAAAPGADVLAIIASELGQPGATAEEIDEAIDALAVADPDAALRILLEVVRQLMPAARPKTPETRGGLAFGDPRRVY
jgi:hypothetical protein